MNVRFYKARVEILVGNRWEEISAIATSRRKALQHLKLNICQRLGVYSVDVRNRIVMCRRRVMIAPLPE